MKIEWTKIGFGFKLLNWWRNIDSPSGYMTIPVILIEVHLKDPTPTNSSWRLEVNLALFGYGVSFFLKSV